MNGKIITADYNLGKFVELKPGQVLNIKDLFYLFNYRGILPGDELEVSIVKNVKSEDDRMTYLDDGTIIAMKYGRRYYRANEKNYSDIAP